MKKELLLFCFRVVFWSATIYFMCRTDSVWFIGVGAVLLGLWMIGSTHMADYWRERAKEEERIAKAWKRTSKEIVLCLLVKQFEEIFENSDVTNYTVVTDKDGEKIACKIGDDDIMVNVDLSFLNDPEKLVKASPDDLDKSIQKAYCLFMSKKGLDVE